MKKFLLIAAAFLFAFGVVQPPAAQARVFVGVGVGGYYPYSYPYYYPYAPYSYYAAPPPVVYTVPPPSPIYAEPPPASAPVSASPASAPSGAAPSQTSPTFIDSAGRTCRHFQFTSGDQAYGTACLMPDGSWRTTQ